MSDKDQTLCDWKKDQYTKDLKKLKEIVRNPRYVCTKCGRAASKKKWLCSPTAL
ncbi:MAG: hypothetical protein PVF43_05745 [Candidatus Eiseniibacteriota bacterium]|jgi:hypothetical protein